MTDEPEAIPMPTVDAYAPEPVLVPAKPVGRLRAMWRFFRDPKASLLGKAFVVLAVAYVIFPFDFLPDFIPVVGWLDDILVLAAACVYLVRASRPYRSLTTAARP
jgi:uncharacterized membrane protein YkvA (DUF1232 family)